MGIDRFAHRAIRADHAGERDGMAVVGDHDVRVVDDGAPLERLADAIGDVARVGSDESAMRFSIPSTP
jgi:hypothetical protein